MPEEKQKILTPEEEFKKMPKEKNPAMEEEASKLQKKLSDTIRPPQEVGSQSVLKQHEVTTNQAASFIASKMMPSGFKTQAQVVIAIETAKALGAKNFGEASLMFSNMFVLDNRINLWGDLPLSLAKSSGFLEDIDEYFIDEKHERICEENKNLLNKPISAVCIIKRKDMNLKKFYLTQQDLDDSGSATSPVWKKYKKIMWRRRLLRQALGASFPECFKGVSLGEYDWIEARTIDIKKESEEKTTEFLEDLNGTEKKQDDKDGTADNPEPFSK